MKLLFDQLSTQVCKRTTNHYSTSFSLGIYFLNSRLRNSIYAIYGFVRVADEIVDSFDGYDRSALLARFSDDTWEAIDQKISCNPILNAFQRAVHEYEIERDLIATFLKSMEMDLVRIQYNSEKYDEYILGSAEVVGLMCLHVFTEGNTKMYDDLKPYAMKLGAAFQKVNFLRDMKYDYQVLGRIYFPNVDMNSFDGNVKSAIEKEIDEDFAIARKGIGLLPSSSRGGVYLAYVYYRSLFRKIKKLGADQVLTNRIRISNTRKMGLMVNSMFEYKMNLI